MHRTERINNLVTGARIYMLLNFSKNLENKIFSQFHTHLFQKSKWTAQSQENNFGMKLKKRFKYLNTYLSIKQSNVFYFDCKFIQ